jgi:Tol biopolymer transport system component
MPALSPDGRRVAYVSNRDGSSSVWVLNLDTNREQRLPLPPAAAWTRPSWSRDGESLLLSRYQDDGSNALIRHHLASARQQALDLPGGDAFAGIEAADGSLLFARSTAAGASLWRWRAGLAPTRLPEAGTIGEFRTDQDWLGYQRRGEPGIVVQRLDGSERRSLLADLGPEQPRNWTLVGDSVVYAGNDAHGRSMLWRLDLRTGERLAWLEAQPDTAGPNIAAHADFASVVISRIDSLHADLLRVPAPQ